MVRRDRLQPLHGDVYRANVLVRDRRLVALVDWDDVLLGKILDPAMRFIDNYAAAGGPGRPDRRS